MVLGTKDHRRPQDDGIGHGREHGGFALGLGMGVGNRRGRVGADGRQVYEAIDAGGAGRLGDAAGPVGVDRRGRLGTGGAQHAHGVDDGIGAGDGRPDRIGESQVGLHRHDLADAAERLQVEGEIGAADGDAHAIAGGGQGANDVATDEAGTAEDGDEAGLLGNQGHACCVRSWPTRWRDWKQADTWPSRCPNVPTAMSPYGAVARPGRKTAARPTFFI